MKLQIPFSCIAFLMWLNGFVFAQQDSIKYEIMQVFKIVDGKKTAASFVKKQKTYTIDNRLIREITFDDSTRQTLNYTFYFYKDNRLFSEECHDKSDSIRYIILHKYNSKGLEKKLTGLNG